MPGLDGTWSRAAVACLLVGLGACNRADDDDSASSSSSGAPSSSSVQASSSAQASSTLPPSSTGSSSAAGTSSSVGAGSSSSALTSSSSGPFHCPGYLLPEESGGTCPCAARDGGTGCTANNCFGGYWCNTNATPNRCVAPLTECAQAVSCPGFLEPNQGGGGCTCTEPNGNCAANGCFGGFYCNTNLAPDRCVPPPTTCPSLSCPGYLAPEQSGGNCTCTEPSGACAANGCFGGFHCNTNVDPNRCVRAPTSCDAGPGCGSVTAAGECQGDVLLYCYNNQVWDLDCATALESSPATCMQISAEWGFDCAVLGTGACAYTGDDGGLDPAFCAAAGAGCVLDPAAGSSACTAGLGTCSPDAGFTPRCDGNRLLMMCNVAQPAGYECAPGTCSGNRCVEPAGGPCDPAATGLLTCSGGLQCVTPDGGAPVCQ